MGYIRTHSGVKFYPMDPDPIGILIEDIAHALPLLCRANGHFPHFYSVAQHSINCAREAMARGESDRVHLACLLHDGSEAYLSDVTRPVKEYLPLYVECETVLQDMIYKKFLGSTLSERESKLVEEIDDAILHFEFKHMTGELIFDPEPTVLSNPFLEFADVEKVRSGFRTMFITLVARLMEDSN